MSERQYPQWVASYIGVPYNKTGWTREEGFHCWSLVRDVLIHEFHIDVPTYRERFADAEDSQNAEKAVFYGIDTLEKQWSLKTESQFGDLLFFRIKRNICHVALCLDSEYMLHVMEGINTSLARYRTPQWIPRFYGAYRHCSLKDLA